MDAMSTLQLSQLREQAAQLLRKYRIPLLVFLLGVALALVPGKTKKTDAQQTTAASADTAFDLSPTQKLSLIHLSHPTRLRRIGRLGKIQL